MSPSAGLSCSSSPGLASSRAKSTRSTWPRPSPPGAQLGIPYIFKASYDKANRTSLGSFRGPGLKQGLAILRKVAECVKVPVLTDVHDPRTWPPSPRRSTCYRFRPFSAVRPICWWQPPKPDAPSTSRRASSSPRGHAPRRRQGARAGNDRVFLTERGASFGYNNLVVDMRSLAIMREFAPVVFDATHSVQLPSAGVQSGGQPQFIPLLSRAAVAAGIDGIFMEVHDNPREAKSDGANALDLKLLRPTLEELLRVRQAVSPRP